MINHYDLWSSILYSAFPNKGLRVETDIHMPAVKQMDVPRVNNLIQLHPEYFDLDFLSGLERSREILPSSHETATAITSQGF